MFFKTTYFFGFRNIRPARKDWSKGLNLIIGPNGAGKTNILEGLSLLGGWGPLESGTKSASLVSRGAVSASLWAEASGEESFEAFMGIGARSRLTIGGKAVSSSKMRARLPIMIFLPDTISIVRGGASARRSLLDRIGSLIYPDYAKYLSDVRKTLRHKTVMLRHSMDTSAADTILSRSGAWLWKAREEIVRMIADGLASYSGMIAGDVNVIHKRGGGGREDDVYVDMEVSLKAVRPRERGAGIALVGPQRDDIVMTCGGVSAAEFFSRGQSRMLSAAIVMTSAKIVERELSRCPVLVFDEMVSDLDDDAASEITSSLLSTGCQIFATGARKWNGADGCVTMRGGAFV